MSLDQYFLRSSESLSEELKKLSQERKLKAGDFFELRLEIGKEDLQFINVPLIWTGKNVYTLNLQTNQMELYSE